jgi:hypothetical protein
MEDNVTFNPLENKRVIVRHLHKDSKIADKRHLLYGGMAENAVKTFTVPVIASTGALKNVLTNNEKEFFENLLGVNLSVHNKKDNYWDNYSVRLTKSDTYLDLSVPEDYIKYKVLLANNTMICPSLQQYHEKPLATYQFVITSDGAELEMAVDKRKIKVECYKLAGKIENDFDTLKAVVELLDKRPIADKTSREFLANKLDEFIDIDAKEVHRVLTDESLKSMVFIKKCVSTGLIIRSGEFYYIKSGKSKVPMCEDGRDPDIKQAVKYINNPKNQELKFNLEAKLTNPED